ncbi:hypothetical protein K1W54_00910 [Micromonospora sp. CPCC 205371]|nr:hypothetical protein [Micromonospora sp. CPCC 205371]
MSSDLPVNNWNSFDSGEVCWWTATFPWALGSGALLPWQDVVLDAGERTGIFRVEAAEWMEYRQEVDGPVGAFVKAHPDRLSISNPRFPAGFLLGDDLRYGEHKLVVSTRLSYMAPGGEIADRWVQDMQEFGLAIGLPSAFSYRPFDVDIDYGYAGSSDMEETWATFSTSTDIWFPWNSPMGRTGIPRGEPLDNRVLSRLNGTRLNAFLGEVREATLAAGGTWTCAPWRDERQADEFGVVLDAPKPARV